MGKFCVSFVFCDTILFLHIVDAIMSYTMNILFKDINVKLIESIRKCYHVYVWIMKIV